MHKYLQLGISFIIILTLFSSCKAKQYTFDNYEGRRIAIGSSGGFTGATTQYYIFENGQLFKRENSDYVELPTLDKRLIQQQFENYYTLGFDKMQINDAGNMSYFITMNPDTEKVQTLRWGGGAVDPDKELEQYYKLLSTIIKKNNKPTK